MFLLNEPATHPRVGDQLYAPERWIGGQFDLILTPHTVTRRSMAKGDRIVYLIDLVDPDGNELLYEKLDNWLFVPQEGDRIVICHGPWARYCQDQAAHCAHEAGDDPADRDQDQWEAHHRAKDWIAAQSAPWAHGELLVTGTAPPFVLALTTDGRAKRLPLAVVLPLSPLRYPLEVAAA